MDFRQALLLKTISPQVQGSRKGTAPNFFIARRKSEFFWSNFYLTQVFVLVFVAEEKERGTAQVGCQIIEEEK